MELWYFALSSGEKIDRKDWLPLKTYGGVTV